MMKCPVCGAKLKQSGSISVDNPTTQSKRKHIVPVMYCPKCNYRTMK